MKNEIIRLRAHHGMCLAFFKGKGYSNSFTDNMQSVLELMQKNPKLQIISDRDVICEECPNLNGGKCATFDLVNDYDKKVLLLCGLTEGSELSWNDFSQLVSDKIISAGKRESICGDCEWSELCKQQR